MLERFPWRYLERTLCSLPAAFRTLVCCIFPFPIPMNSLSACFFVYTPTTVSTSA